MTSLTSEMTLALSRSCRQSHRRGGARSRALAHAHAHALAHALAYVSCSRARVTSLTSLSSFHALASGPNFPLSLEQLLLYSFFIIIDSDYFYANDIVKLVYTL